MRDLQVLPLEIPVASIAELTVSHLPPAVEPGCVPFSADDDGGDAPKPRGVDARCLDGSCATSTAACCCGSGIP